MLDTVKLCLNEWEIKKGANLTVQPSPVNYGTGELIADYPLWQRKGGEAERGSKAYMNTPHLNLEVVPYYQGRGGVQCFVHFSIPKIHNGENYYSVGKEGTQAVLKQVEGELFEAGVHTNIQEASLSRIDTFQNVITEEAFLSYSPLFSLLQASRKQRRDYGTTFLWSNSQQELCVYDKLAEMENRKINTLSYPAKTMRFEYRLLNKRKIESTVGFSKVKELPTQWGVFKEKFKEAWGKNLFNIEVGEVEILASKQIINEMRYFKEKYKRDWLDYFLKAFGAYSLGKVAGLEPVKLAIEELEQGQDKNTVKVKVQRAIKKIENAKKEMELIRGEDGRGKTLATLYKELQVKVCLN